MSAASSLPPTPRRSRRKALTWAFVAFFLLPVFGAFGALAYRGGPTHWSQWDRSVTGRLGDAASHPEARILVMSGRTRGWKGALAVHSWIDIKGAQAQAFIPRIEAAIKNYQYANYGDYRMWPGPNSNTFVATVLRSVPELGVAMPPNAVGRDYRALPYLGWSDSGTGVEASLWGVLGVKLGWVEGIELNVLGLVAGLDLRHPALKLPALGRIGVDAAVARAAGSRP